MYCRIAICQAVVLVHTHCRVSQCYFVVQHSGIYKCIPTSLSISSLTASSLSTTHCQLTATGQLISQLCANLGWIGKSILGFAIILVRGNIKQFRGHVE